MSDEFRYDEARLAASIAGREQAVRAPLIALAAIPVAGWLQNALHGGDIGSIARPAGFVAALVVAGALALRRAARESAAERGCRYRVGDTGLERVDAGGAALEIPFAGLTPEPAGFVRWRHGAGCGFVDVPSLDRPAEFLSRLAGVALGARAPDEVLLEVRIRTPREILKLGGPLALLLAAIIAAAVLSRPLTAGTLPALAIVLAAIPGFMLASLAVVMRFIQVAYRFSPAGIDREETGPLRASRCHAAWAAVHPAPGGLPRWPVEAMPPPRVLDARTTWTYFSGFHGGWLRHRTGSDGIRPS